MLWQDSITVGTLILLEGLLSTDNALVMAVLVKHLEPPERKKALHYGIWAAFLLRLLCVLLAAWLIHAWAFKAVGALYLLYISLNHVFSRAPYKTEERQARHLSFWKTVVVVELANLVFSVDSILAAVALSPKIWIVYLGGIAGIAAMRFVAGWVSKLLDRFPGLERGAYILVGWIGLKLGLEMCEEKIAGFPHLLHPVLFWSVMCVIFFGSMLWKIKKR